MHEGEWESLCDGCAHCCAIPDTGVACPYLDTVSRRCTVYERRFALAPWCRKVTPDNTLELHAKNILPASCAYVRHKTGQPQLPPDQVPIARLIPYNLADRRVVEKHQRIANAQKP